MLVIINSLLNLLRRIHDKGTMLRDGLMQRFSSKQYCFCPKITSGNTNLITFTKNHWGNKTGQLVQPADVLAARK